MNKTVLNKNFVSSKNLSELELNKIYEITDIKKAKTMYGIIFFVIIEKNSLFFYLRGRLNYCKIADFRPLTRTGE